MRRLLDQEAAELADSSPLGARVPLLRAAALDVPAPSKALVPAELTMVKAPKRRGPRVVIVLDSIGVGLGLSLGALLLHLGLGVGVEGGTGRIGLRALLFLPIYLLAFSSYGVYFRQRRRLFASSFPDLGYLAHALVAGGTGVLIASHFLHPHLSFVPRLSLTGAVVLTLPSLVTVPATRVVGGAVLKMRGLVRSRVIILGSGVVADRIARRLAGFDDIELIGLVDEQWRPSPGTVEASGMELLGQIPDLPQLCKRFDVDRVVVAFSPAAAPELADILRELPSSIRISVVPRLFDLLTWRSSVDELHGLPLMDVAPPVLNLSRRLMKRTLDLIVVSVILVIGLPFWIIVAVAIKLTSPGSVFFKQLRTGHRSESFWIYKFRTMRVGAEAEKESLDAANDVDGPLFKIKDDPRITKVGRFLRATSIDELPQLINVLKGEMSIVGPRPFVVSEASLIDGWASRRFDVRPGMTGLWQVSGRNDLPFEELRRLDYAYVASWSLWWDIKILWQTPGSVLRGRGAY